MQRPILASGVAAFTLALASGISAQPMPAQTYPFKAGPVTVLSCSLGQAGNTVAGNSLEIKYFQNVPRRHLVSVTFRIRYAGQVTTVTDNGTFSYDATIDHKFNVLGGTPWAGPDPEVCRVVSATFGDGKTVTPTYPGAGSPGGDAAGGPPASSTVPPYATQPGAPPPPASPGPAAT